MESPPVVICKTKGCEIDNRILFEYHYCNGLMNSLCCGWIRCHRGQLDFMASM